MDDADSRTLRSQDKTLGMNIQEQHLHDIQSLAKRIDDTWRLL